MTIFFTADTHFGDHRVLNISKRPFGSVAEMDAAMILRWNSVVASQVEVWHLGDFARTRKIAAVTLPVLNGRKHLIIGNNDPTEVLELDWASVQHYAETQVEGTRLVLCHYPFRTWNGMAQGTINLHGHSHGRLKPPAAVRCWCGRARLSADHVGRFDGGDGISADCREPHATSCASRHPKPK
jgi:calcineurin-like phosphoesterase family protein